MQRPDEKESKPGLKSQNNDKFLLNNDNWVIVIRQFFYPKQYGFGRRRKTEDGRPKKNRTFHNIKNLYGVVMSFRFFIRI